MARAAVETPVEPGEVDVTATVTIRYQFPGTDFNSEDLGKLGNLDASGWRWKLPSRTHCQRPLETPRRRLVGLVVLPHFHRQPGQRQGEWIS